MLFCRADGNRKFLLQQVVFSEKLLNRFPNLRKLPPPQNNSKEVRAWQVFYQFDGGTRELELPEKFDIVCSPVCWPTVDGDALAVSWVGGKMQPAGMIYYLYAGYWQPGATVSAARKLYRTSVGFSTPPLTVWLQRPNRLWLSDGRVAEMAAFRMVYRVCPVWDDAAQILVTGEIAGEMATHGVNLQTGTTRELLLNNRAVYKSTVRGGQVTAAIKDPTADESHHLESGTTEWRDALTVTFVQATTSDQERAWPSKAKKISGCCDSAKNYEK